MFLRENAHYVLALAVTAEALQFDSYEALYCLLLSACMSQYAGFRPNTSSYRCVSMHFQKVNLFQLFIHTMIILNPNDENKTSNRSLLYCERNLKQAVFRALLWAHSGKV